jgi:hypothetical protein
MDIYKRFLKVKNIRECGCKTAVFLGRTSPWAGNAEFEFDKFEMCEEHDRQYNMTQKEYEAFIKSEEENNTCDYRLKKEVLEKFIKDSEHLPVEYMKLSHAYSVKHNKPYGTIDMKLFKICKQGNYYCICANRYDMFTRRHMDEKFRLDFNTRNLRELVTTMEPEDK